MADQKPLPIFVGDHVALDFLNSVAAPKGQLIDWLESGEDLVSWLELANAIGPEVAEAVRKSSSTEELNRAALNARELRDWFRSFVVKHAGRPLSRNALPELAPVNDILKTDHSYRQISASEPTSRSAEPPRVFGWDRKRHGRDAQSLLLPIADAMGDLVCETDFTFVRQCEAPECVLWFSDVSKSHARRWCSMAICGNRMKAAAHRERRRKGSAAARDRAPSSLRRPRRA